jgi:hypothetical protein
MIIMGNLILAEVHQGFRSDDDYRIASGYFSGFRIGNMIGREITVKSADHYRLLREKTLPVGNRLICSQAYIVLKTVSMCSIHRKILIHWFRFRNSKRRSY